jgi:hypothetical protein
MKFYAMPINSLVVFSNNALVYVLIPNNDFSKQKFILTAGGNDEDGTQ